MYINKIDELIDTIINDFYLTVVSENTAFQKILKETDYIKYQKDINDMMINFIKKININDIKHLVKSNSAVHQIYETIKRYIAYYLFLTIGFFYTEKEDLFLNNIIEFTKNQGSYGYKIEEFFNSDSNAHLIQYNKLITNIIVLLESDQSKVDKIKNNKIYQEPINFLNELGGEYIKSKFLIKNKSLQAHNIIKTLIIIFMYEKRDKKTFFKLLEASENAEGEYMFIDIVVPVKKTIDYAAIENIIGDIHKSKHLTYYLWKYLNDYDDLQDVPPLSNDEKILSMINSGIIVPISEDFLLYHNDSEKYDKTIDETKIKKKEDTKIKYIVNKIDKVKEYYSEQIKNDQKTKSDIEKLFYAPLLNRKVILINVKEDISIINKFINIGKHNVENFDYFRDLEQYKLYPYINFNDFEQYGFSLQLTKTINMIRNVSLQKSGKFKQLSGNNIAQTRVGSKDMFVNIVGFMIPSNITALQCSQLKNIKDIRSISKNQQNGLSLVTQYLKESHFNSKKHLSSLTWLFDEEKDTIHIDSYEQTGKFTMQDKIKNVVAQLYNNIQNDMYDVISELLEKNKDITIQEGFKIIDYYQTKFLKMSLIENIQVQLEQDLYRQIEKNQFEPLYDINEDAIYSIMDDNDKNNDDKKIVMKQNTIPVVKINVSSLDEYGEKKNKEVVEGVCQHNISQENIASIDKKDFVRYSEEINKFMQQYVMMNVNDEYICKSCGFNLDIKRYIEEGEYNNDTKSFTSYSTPIDINLEDIIGYEKFKITIRQIDKIIERIAIISNILHLTRNTTNVKPRRKLIVKNAIDIIIANNKHLRNKSKEREISTKKYGINKKYSDVFLFDLENNIFVISTKDIDQFKPVKQNNIIAYIIFLMTMEVNQSHIMYMGNDKKKLCNFRTFEKVMDSLFGGLKLIINNKGHIENITNYKILCYIIYIIACTISQTKLWYIEIDKSNILLNVKGKNLAIQKLVIQSIIHTTIEIINSVLEVTNAEPDNFLYNMLGGKFLKKLQEIYRDESLFERLKKESSSSSFSDKKESIAVTQDFISLSGKYIPMTYVDPERRICKCPVFLINKKRYILPKYLGISNLSNCDDGKYHIWKLTKGELICYLCQKHAKDINYNENNSKDIKNKFKNTLNKELAEKICMDDGLLHIFETSDNGELICKKCKKSDTYKYSEDELNKIHKLVIKVNAERNERVIDNENKITEFAEKKQDYIKTAIGKLLSEYNKEKSQDLGFLNKLMDEIQQIIGNEFLNSHLTDNIYIIDHDHLGNKLDKSITFMESHKKIFERNNHPYFKTNVLYYTNHKHGKIDVFYDATTKILLGYKEENKKFVENKDYDKRIKLNYSLLNKIKMFGYKSPFIKTDDDYKLLIEGREDIDTDSKDITKQIIESIIKSRISQIKKILLNLKIILSRILNGYNEELHVDEYSKAKINVLIDKYKKKLIDPNVTDKTGQNMIFKHWKAIMNGLIMEDTKNIKITHDFSKDHSINYSEINKIDNAGNMLIYYISRELVKFFDYNPNKVIKSEIANFIVDFINIIFDIFNEEKNNTDIEIKKYIYRATTNIKEIEEKSSAQNLEGIYSEYKDNDDDKTTEEIEQEREITYDDTQEFQARDVDIDKEDIDEEGQEFIQEYDLE